MIIDRLINNNGAGPLLERWVRFTEARHEILAEDVANVDVPGYVQKDLSVSKFQEMLRNRDISQSAEAEPVETGLLYHDGGNRSMESLMSEEAKNALMHNIAVELLRRQFATLELAIKEKVG